MQFSQKNAPSGSFAAIKPSKSKGLLPFLLALGVLLVLTALLAASYFMDPLGCRIAPGVTVGGLNVGGMRRLNAYRALEAAGKEVLLAGDLTVVLPDETLTITAKDAGLKLDTWQAVTDAYAVGRNKKSAGSALQLSQYLRVDEKHIRSLLEDYAEAYGSVLTQPQWALRGQAPQLGTEVLDPENPGDGQTIELTLGTPEKTLDVEKTLELILSAYDTGLARVSILRPDTVSRTEPEKPDLQQIYDTCSIPAENDSLDMKTFQLVHGSYGYHFDMEAAALAVKNSGYGDTLTIPMVPLAPEVLGEGVYFRDELGHCETKHTNNKDRNTNLRLVCELLDGMILQPGEEFSYNMAVGERTPERGFLMAPAFSGSAMTNDYGGGVCQGSTTLYNCLLQAEMEVLERHGHGALVSYIKLGLDAAVNWATQTDLRFRNNSNFPVMIKAELSQGYMKMWLMGTDEKDYYIEMEATQYQQEDYFYATSYRCKYDKDTDELLSREQVAFSSYKIKLD